MKKKSELDYLYDNMKRIEAQKAQNYKKFIRDVKPPVDKEGNYVVHTKENKYKEDARTKKAMNAYKRDSNISAKNVKNLYSYSKDLNNGLIEVDDKNELTYTEKLRDRTTQIKTATDYLKILFNNDQEQINIFSNYLIENNLFERFNDLYPELYSSMEKSRAKGANNAIKLFKRMMKNDIDDQFVFSETNMKLLVNDILSNIKGISIKSTDKLFRALKKLEEIGEDSQNLDENFKAHVSDQINNLLWLITEGNLKQNDVINAISNMQVNTKPTNAPQQEEQEQEQQEKETSESEPKGQTIGTVSLGTSSEDYKQAIEKVYSQQIDKLEAFKDDYERVVTYIQSKKDAAIINFTTQRMMRRLSRVFYGGIEGINRGTTVKDAKEIMYKIEPKIKYIIGKSEKPNPQVTQRSLEAEPKGQILGTVPKADTKKSVTKKVLPDKSYDDYKKDIEKIYSDTDEPMSAFGTDYNQYDLLIKNKSDTDKITTVMQDILKRFFKLLYGNATGISKETTVKYAKEIMKKMDPKLKYIIAEYRKTQKQEPASGQVRSLRPQGALASVPLVARTRTIADLPRADAKDEKNESNEEKGQKLGSGFTRKRKNYAPKRRIYK